VMWARLKALVDPSKREVNIPDYDDILMETCDGLLASQSDAFCNGGSRTYPAQVPWDVPLRLAVSSFVIIAFTLVAILVPELYEFHKIPPTMLTVAVIFGLLIGGFAVLSQIPKNVVRKADSLEIQFFTHSHRVPLDDVLELVVLRDGRQFWQLLRRWKVFPNGQRFSFFFGAPSNNESLCVLLTSPASGVLSSA